MRWSSFGISSVVKPEPREKKKKRDKNIFKKKTKTKKNGFLQDVGCSERCGVKFCSLQQQQVRQITITSLKILRFIWRCFTVAVVVMSLRAFYDCTLIVEALFYTESYFRIQYVLLYIKCIVWRKLNKCCLKSTSAFVTLCWIQPIIVLACALSQIHYTYTLY